MINTPSLAFKLIFPSSTVHSYLAYLSSRSFTSYHFSHYQFDFIASFLITGAIISSYLFPPPCGGRTAASISYLEATYLSI